MQPLKQPKTAHELLALWDELVQQASPEDADGLRNNRGTYYDAAFRQECGTGELDDMPEYHEVWWASALRLYRNQDDSRPIPATAKPEGDSPQRTSHETSSTIRPHSQPADARAKLC